MVEALGVAATGVRASGGDAAFYEKGHRVYQALYPALKPVYGQIAGL